jgi:fibronectin-binding autotransporter adhesin
MKLKHSLAVISIGMLSSVSAMSQVTTTWNGSGTDWNTATDWNSTVPTAADTASFDATGNAQLNVTLSGAGAATNIQFLNGAGAYTIGTPSGPAITLTSGGSISSNFGVTSLVETINAPLIIGNTSASTYTIHQNIVSSDEIDFGGSISGAASAGNNTQLSIADIKSTFGGVIGDGANGGTLSLLISGNALINLTQAETYTGTTTISNEGVHNGGTVNVTGSGSFGATAITVGTSGILNLNTAGAISQGTPLIRDGGTLNINATNGITGTAGLKSISGNVNLNQAVNYTGNTEIAGNSGTFIVSGAGAFGNTAVTVDMDFADGVGYAGTLQLNAAGAISQNLFTINGGNVTQGVAGAITGTTSVYVNESPQGNYGLHGAASFGGGNTYLGTTTLDESDSRVTLTVSSLANGGIASSIGASSNAAGNLVFGGGDLQVVATTAQSTDRLFTIGDAFSNNQNYYGNSYSATIDSSSLDPNATVSFTNTGAIVSGMGGVSINQSSLILTGSNTGANVFAPLITDLASANSASTSLTKSGAGNWILTNANTFTGNTTIQGGSLQLGNFNALHNSSVILNSTNGLTFSGSGTYNIGSLSGSADETIGAGVTLGLGPVIPPLARYGNTYTYGGVLSGAGGISQQSSANTEVFTANNTYTGPTSVIAGTLRSTSSTSGTPFGTGSLDLDGGVLAFAPSGSGAAIVDTAASGTGAAVTYGGNGNITLNKGSNTSLTLTLGDGSDPALVRSGPGTLTLQTNSADLGSGENIFVSGPAPVLTNGIVDPSIVGFNNGTNVYDFLTYGANGFVDATNYANHSTDFTTTAGEIANITGNVTVTDSGANPYALRINNDTLNIASNNTLTIGDGSHPATIIFNGGAIGAGNGNSVLNFGPSQGLVYSNGYGEFQSIVAGTGGLVVSGTNSYYGNPGAVQFDNNGNTFSGGITLNEGTTLLYTGGSNNNQFKNGTLGDPNNVVTLNGGEINAGSSIFGIGRNISLTSLGGTLVGNANFAANISGSGGLSVGTYPYYQINPRDYGHDFTVLSGNNTFTGGLTLFNNYTAVSSNSNLGASTGAVNFDGGFFAVMGDNMHDFGSHTVNFASAFGVVLDIQDANNTFTLSQSLNQGSGGLSKMGSGTLVLTGTETYTGTTSLFGGTLQVNEATSPISSSSGLFFDGGTLDIVGNSTGTTVQSFNGLTMGINNNTSDVTTGGGTIIADGNGGAGTTVNLGTINLAGTNVSSPNTANYGAGAQTGNTLGLVVKGNASITTTSAPDGTTGNSGNGIYGGRVVYTDAAGNTNWATSDSSGPVYTITGYNGYSFFNPDDNGSDDPTNNDEITNAALTTMNGGDSVINSLKIANTLGAGTFNLDGHNLELMSGGLLFTGTSNFTISSSIAGGTLTSGLLGTSQNNTNSTGDDLIIQDYGTGTLTISAVIANGPDGPSTLTKAGPGTLVLSGANTYTGQTFVNGGLLSAASAGNISTARLNLNGGGFEATGTFTSPHIALGSSGGTLDVTAGNVLTVPEIAGFIGGQHQSPASLTINSNGDTGTVFLDYNGNLAGNTFYGGIVIDGGTLRLGNYGGGNDTSALGTTPGNYISWGASSSGDLQLNGTPELVAGLQSTSASAIVEDGANGNSLLGVSNGDDETYAGTLVDSVATGPTGKLSFLKTGGGSLAFTNANSSYTGRTELDGGILNVAFLTNGGSNSSIGASSNAASNLIFGGGTIQYTGSTAQTTDRLFTLGDTGVGGNNGTIDSSGSNPLSFTNTGAVVLANTGVHNLDLAGTNTGANTFAPSLGDSAVGAGFATSLTKSGPGTWVLTNTNSYSGGTTVSGGTLYANGGVAGNSSGAGVGAVNVASGGAFGGSGVYRPTVAGAGITLASGGSLISGGIQGPISPLETAGLGLTLDNRAANGVIMNAGSGGANLTFYLGAGNISNPTDHDYASPNMNSTFMTVLGNAPGELAFAAGDSITVNDLTGVNNLQLSIGTPYLLIQAGSGLAADNSLYSGLVTSGGVIDGVVQNGWVLNLTLNGSATTSGPTGLYLFNGELEVVPEPGTWALMLGGLVFLVLLQRRRCESKLA